MRLCFIGHMLGRNPGRVTTQGQVIADLFAGEGFEVTAVSSKVNRLLRLSEVVFTLIRGWRRYDVVVLETFSGLSFVMADVVSLICKLLRLPLVMVLHGGNLPAFAQKRARWVRTVLCRAGKLVAPSEFIATKFRRLGFEVGVIPNSIEINRYPFKEREKIRPRLIWMRSFHPIYNPEMAVRVLARLSQVLPEATLTMAGADKGIRARVEDLAAEMNLSDAIRFVGFLDHSGKLAEFSGSDIYLNTNRIDNMPVSVIEARALGLPVVATDVGGLRYMINHGEDGFLVPDNDDDEMVAAIRKLLENPHLTNRVSRSGREVAELSDWRRVRAQWIALLSTVSDSGRPSTLPGDARYPQC